MINQAIREKLEKWLDEHFDELVGELAALVRIPSVATYDDPDTPYGPDCLRALKAMLALGERNGFAGENCGDRCATLTRRPGKDAADEIHVWCHLDVVPAGDGWTLTTPFEPVIRDDYMVARGADDNKGPAVGVLFVLRALEELGIPTRHGLRLCVGTDEEHGMQDVKYYAENYPAPALSIIADSGFPVCYGEKGIIEATIVTDAPLTAVTRMKAGMASNIVPDKAEMTLRGEASVSGEWVTAEAKDGRTALLARGLSRHSAFPEGGVNAIHELTKAALDTGLLPEGDQKIMAFFTRVNDDFLGTALGIDGSDDLSGYTTCVGSMLNLREDGRAALHVNVRHRIGADSNALVEAMARACRENGCTLERAHISAPNYFPRENPVVDALTGVFNEVTGENREPFVMGGGTYARKLPHALAFGLGGMNRPETTLFAPGHGGAHQPDEGLYLPNLKKALLIFALGLIEADRVLE